MKLYIVFSADRNSTDILGVFDAAHIDKFVESITKTEQVIYNGELTTVRYRPECGDVVSINLNKPGAGQFSGIGNLATLARL